MALRGHDRYLYVKSVAEYHQTANPIIQPIAGANFRFPRTLEISQKRVRQQGPLLRSLHPVVPDNGWHNTIAAFRKRCNYFSAKRASPFIVRSALDLVSEICPKRLEPFEWSRPLYEDWLAKFGAEKQARMEEALRTLSSSKLPDYTSKDIFVKVEALLVEHKPNWAPRVIFKGTDLYNAISGPIFNELMRRFDMCLENMRGPIRMRCAYKKTTLDYVGSIEAPESGGAWIEADFSSNDKFQCSDVQLLEVAMMRELGCPEWFVRLHLKSNKFTVKSSNHGIRATLQNQLATGATDTTFRNTFWNACILKAFCVKMKIKRCQAMLLGDDMLAWMAGLGRHACKVYISVASEAQMVATVFRHDCLFKCGFLSKFFVPRRDGCHLTVPILGKALGRFNMRANNNEAVSDAGYMAGKSVSYAYEFRFIPSLRDLFLRRFVQEFKLMSVKERDAARSEIEIGWNARAAGVTLKNIRQKILERELVSECDFSIFCFERYGCPGSDVIDLFEQVVVSREMIDVEGTVVSILAKDFL
jgi:hypothetical protein